MIALERRAYELAIRDSRYTCRALVRQGNRDGLRYEWVNYRNLMKELHS